MGRNAIFTETDIVQAGQYLEALHPGKTVSPGQIRDHLDGGNVGRIREIWERHLKQRAEAADRARAARISLPSELRTYLVAEEKSFTERIDELCGKVFDIAKKAVQAERAEVPLVTLRCFNGAPLLGCQIVGEIALLVLVLGPIQREAQQRIAELVGVGGIQINVILAIRHVLSVHV